MVTIQEVIARMNKLRPTWNATSSSRESVADLAIRCALELCGQQGHSRQALLTDDEIDHVAEQVWLTISARTQTPYRRLLSRAIEAEVISRIAAAITRIGAGK